MPAFSNEHRNRWLRVRLTPTEDKMVDEAAQRAGMTRSDFVRVVLASYFERDQQRDDL